MFKIKKIDVFNILFVSLLAVQGLFGSNSKAIHGPHQTITMNTTGRFLNDALIARVNRLNHQVAQNRQQVAQNRQRASNRAWHKTSITGRLKRASYYLIRPVLNPTCAVLGGIGGGVGGTALTVAVCAALNKFSGWSYKGLFLPGMLTWLVTSSTLCSSITSSLQLSVARRITNSGKYIDQGAQQYYMNVVKNNLTCAFASAIFGAPGIVIGTVLGLHAAKAVGFVS